MLIDTKLLRQKILDLAIRGKLVPQDPADEPASELLKRIRAEKSALVKAGKLKKEKHESAIFRDSAGHYLEKKDGKTTDITNEIPFDLPLSWCWCRIDTVAFVTKLAGFEYTNHIAPNLSKGGIPLFKGKNIQGNNIIYEFESFIPKNVSDNLPRSQINKKCILLPYVGTLGNIGVHYKKGIYHLGSNVGKIELTCNNSNTLLLEEFIVFYLRSSYGFKGLVREKKATAQDSISIQAIRNICIPIPPVPEQHRIVSQIGKVFGYVDEIDQNADSLEKTISMIKQKVLDLAIRGKLVPQDPADEPASELLKRINAEKAAHSDLLLVWDLDEVYI